ncbi:MAG: hypothetical protein H6500_01085 [Candidatus Woesearchaeota archaeon]|nr:hypothetical protein [Nanoarchaeota archaeon]USN44426.1 MAG: hypothetical protein H6500_01085 [Candidatus Woesearchaeota archaeon]
MCFFQKAFSPLIAVALLLIVTVVAIVLFSTWFNSFRSSLFTVAETEIGGDQVVGIVDLVGNELFFQAGVNTSVSFVRVSGNTCDFSSGVYSGLHVFDLTSCLTAGGEFCRGCCVH